MSSVQELKTALIERQQELDRTLEKLQTILEVVTRDQPPADSIQMAAEMGRLDLVAILLAVIGVFLGGLGVFGFIEIRYRAKAIATEVAELEAKKTVEIVAPGLIGAAVDIRLAGDINSAMANAIMAKVDPEKEKTKSKTTAKPKTTRKPKGE